MMNYQLNLMATCIQKSTAGMEAGPYGTRFFTYGLAIPTVVARELSGFGGEFHPLI